MKGTNINSFRNYYMKIIFKQLLILFFIFLRIDSSYCQSSIKGYPKIDSICPDFTLDSVEHFYKRNVTLDDFQGRWLVLDFWGEFCSSCIRSFPKINVMQKEFEGKVQFLLVTDTYKDPRTAMALYEKIRKNLNLDIPVSYDQEIVENFQIASLPTIIIIDPKGVVRAITYTLNSKDLGEFLAGGSPKLARNYLLTENPSEEYDREILLLTFNNGGSDTSFIFRSVLTQWRKTMPGYNITISKDRFEAFYVDAKTLYRLAFTGRDHWNYSDTLLYSSFYYNPILKVRDSSLFLVDRATGKNLFSYSICFPEERMAEQTYHPYSIERNPKLQQMIRRDLENYFGFDVQVEVRKMPCYRLIATKEARIKLKTKGEKTSVTRPDGEKAGIVAKNIPIYQLLRYLNNSGGHPKLSETGLTFIDDTGILGNIDIIIDAIYFSDWIKELNKNGLRLEHGEREMKVIVIRDK